MRNSIALGNAVVKRLEQFQQKCKRFCVQNCGKNNNLEHVHDSEKNGRALDPSTISRILQGVAVLFFLSLAIAVTGKWIIKSSTNTVYSVDTSVRKITIGNDVVVAPANMIRFHQARKDGAAERLDLYFRWPDMTGYTLETHDDFNHAGDSRRILFVTLERRTMSHDMSGRFEPVYQSLINSEGTAAPGGLMLHDFKPDSGYSNEILAVAQPADRQVFVARCLTGPDAEKMLAPCERDIHIGDGLSLNYRFPRELLQGWRSLEAAILARAREYVKTAR